MFSSAMKWVIDRYRRFCEWAKQPYRVAPNSTQRHVCSTCATCFVGNYCPRCGQSARIGRYSFRNAFLLFLDVWGLGNRGMFRSVRDLMLRPGYMIRDYLSGMQMAYYPPFKMLFLIGALSLLVETGLNVEGVNRAQMSRQNDAEYLEREKAKANADASLTDAQKYARTSVNEYFYVIESWVKNNASLATLAFLLLFSIPLWLMFRKSPAIPDLRLSECFVAMVYITNMLLILSLVPSFLCFSFEVENRFMLLSFLLVIVPIKQLSGYSYWTTAWRLLLSVVPFVVVVFLVSIVVFEVYFIVSAPDLFLEELGG